ncbi:MAG: hypothetical protein ABI068_08765 [Ktedonobacterales bacterium]
MVHTKPPGGGGSGGGSHRRHGGGKPKSHKRRSSHKRQTHPRVHHTHHTRAPAVPVAQQAHVGQTLGGEGGLPRQGHTGSGPSPALALAAPFGSGLFDALLEVVGAEHLTVRGMFEAWQREQDRAFNRSWRRPGGLARPAGL